MAADDDEFDADTDFLAALAASEIRTSQPSRPMPQARLQQPTPQKIQQPSPQRLDKPPSGAASASGPKIVQPTPQALPGRSSGSSILVSPRQKGNPVLASLKSLPWEYSDIPADYVLGMTTCALFLSLKYHRLHPEYIYTRIKNLQGKYNLRILLTMVDIQNHEDSLRELSKTSLVNNVTVILCWSAAEAARYLELYKSYEHANFSAIRGQQSTTYAEKLVDFVTVPRSVNKADAVALVSSFGSLRNAINADTEQIALISGWGERKVKSWLKTVEEPFRVQSASKRQRQRTTADNEASGLAASRAAELDDAIPVGGVPLRDMAGKAARPNLPGPSPSKSSPSKSRSRFAEHQIWNPDIEDGEDAMMAAAMEESQRTAHAHTRAQKAGSGVTSTRIDENLSDGVAAALAKLRESR